MPSKKRSSTTNGEANGTSDNKKVKVGTTHARKKDQNNNGDDPLRQPHPSAAESEDHGIVLRAFYPAEMSNARARAYTDGTLPRPMDELTAALESTASARAAIPPADAVVHWFRSDLRVHDNRGLSLAGAKARAAGVPLVGLYVLSPEDLDAHLAAPARVDFALRSLAVLRADLAALDIPLRVETVARRSDLVARVRQLVACEWRASHLFANMEYEVDELRRDARLVRLLAEPDDEGQAAAVDFTVVHDTCVVPPGTLHTGAGKQYAVYTPWFRAWVAHLHDAEPGLLDASPPPEKNPASVRKHATFAALFQEEVPEQAPANKRLQGGKEEAKRLRELWPAGENAARERLRKFCDDRVTKYAARRNLPAEDGATSALSAHFVAGTLSARAAVRGARDRNKTKRLDGGDGGIATWISEVAWRDFYKHVLVNWPYVCMNKPFKPEYSDIEWSYNAEHFAAWCEGRTGYPLVDAAMRQLRAQGYVHNRCRMVAASFLAKDLLLDWRLGERFFMEHLIDGDFASNNGGWGFAASVGVDPQPYFRVFNPTLQSEKFDPDGTYIRRWVSELRAVKSNKAVHDPYDRGAAAEASRNGYPRKIVDHKESRERALKAYKAGIERGK